MRPQNIHTPLKLILSVFLFAAIISGIMGEDAKSQEFPDYNFKFASPGSGWTWMENKPEGTVCCLSDDKGRLLSISVEKLNGNKGIPADAAQLK